MIEEIGGVGFEIVRVEGPVTERDHEPELMLFIALAVEWDEAAIRDSAELKQRAGNRDQWRRLIIVAVESAEGPVDAGKVDRETEAWADGAFALSGRKVSGAHASGESEPRDWFEFVIQEEGCEAAGWVLA